MEVNLGITTSQIFFLLNLVLATLLVWDYFPTAWLAVGWTSPADFPLKRCGTHCINLRPVFVCWPWTLTKVQIRQIRWVLFLSTALCRVTLWSVLLSLTCYTFEKFHITEMANFMLYLQTNANCLKFHLVQLACLHWGRIVMNFNTS